MNKVLQPDIIVTLHF